jgi:hypothetical protein
VQQIRAKIRKRERKLSFPDTEEVDDLTADSSHPGDHSQGQCGMTGYLGETPA